MGYYTEFTLRAKRDDGPAADTIREVVIAYDFPLSETGNSYDSVKWYDHEDEIKSVSRIYPEVVFALRGHGENIGDDWIKYFKNGRMYTHKITEELFEFYDERNLK